MIMNLARPLADIDNAIQQRLAVIAHQDGQECAIPVIDLKKNQLEYTQLVCTSTKCMNYLVEGRQTYYKCIQKYDPVKLHGEKCIDCGCDWNAHTTITYKTTSTLTYQLNYGMKKDQLVKELTIEQNHINRKRAQFACFLKMNALISQNDATDKYLSRFVTNSALNISEKTQENLEYEMEFNRLYEAMNDPNSNIRSLKPSDIKQIIMSLYSMKHVRPLITNLVDYTDTVGDESNTSHLEQKVELSGQQCDDKTENILHKICNERKGKPYS